MSAQVAMLVIAVLCGTACTLAGLFLVLRRMAMMADAISHSVLPGLIVGYVLANGPNVWVGMLGAIGSGLATVATVEWIKRSRLVKEDAAIGLVFPVMFAAGVFVISRSFRNVHLDTDAVLYGAIELAPLDTLVINGHPVGPQAILVLVTALAMTTLYLVLFFKELQFSTFDPESAEISGIRPFRMHMALMAVVALNTVASFSAVGAILTIALTVGPTACAMLLSKRMSVIITLAIGVSWLCAGLGFFIAYQADISVGGTMASLLGVCFLVAMVAGPRYGMVAQALAQRGHRLEFAVQTLVVHLANHEGTDAAALECNVGHLNAELGWDERWSAIVVRDAERRAWVIESNGDLTLTEVGRAWFEAQARENRARIKPEAQTG